MKEPICPKCKSDDVSSNPNFNGYSVNTCNYCGKDWVSKIESQTTNYADKHDSNNNDCLEGLSNEDNTEADDYDNYDYYEDITRNSYKWLVVYENGATDKIRAYSISELLISNSLSYSQTYITNIIRL